LKIRLRIEQQNADPIQRLQCGLLAYVKFAFENQSLYSVEFMLPISEDLRAEQWTRGDSPEMLAFDFLSKSVHDCVGADKFRQVDPEVVNQIFCAGIHDVASLLTIHYDDLPPREAKQLIHSMVHALLAGVSQTRLLSPSAAFDFQHRQLTLRIWGAFHSYSRPGLFRL
jgi:hypothetical protein